MKSFLEIKNKQEWQKLLDKVLFKTFFHSLEWESFLEKEFKWLKFKRFIWKEQALISLAEVFGKKLVSHPFCEYGGILPFKYGIDFEGFEQDFQAGFKGFDFKISFHPQLRNYFGGVSQDRFYEISKESKTRTYFIENFNKKTEKELWGDLRKTLRYKIEKAEKQDLEIKKCETKKELGCLYDLFLLNSKKHKIPAYPFSFFDYFLNSQNAEIVLAKLGKKIVGGSVFLFYEKHIHYFKNASNKVGMEKGANHLILWETIKKYCYEKNGEFKIFDFGATKKDSSLEIFKRGWGAHDKPICELSNFQQKGKEKYSFLRKVWGCLPIFLIKILSPYFLKYKL